MSGVGLQLGDRFDHQDGIHTSTGVGQTGQFGGHLSTHSHHVHTTPRSDVDFRRVNWGSPWGETAVSMRKLASKQCLCAFVFVVAPSTPSPRNDAPIATAKWDLPSMGRNIGKMNRGGSS